MDIINELINTSLHHMQGILNNYVYWRYWVGIDKQLFEEMLNEHHSTRFNIHAYLLEDNQLNKKLDQTVYCISHQYRSMGGVNGFYYSNDNYKTNDELDVYFISTILNYNLVALITDIHSIKEKRFGLWFIEYPISIKVSEYLPLDYYDKMSICLRCTISPSYYSIIENLMHYFDSYQLLLKM